MNNKTIRVYGPQTKEYQRLEAAARLINADFEHNYATARVSDEWFDYPGGVRWSTIVIGEHQALTPEQQVYITDGSLREFTYACAAAIEAHRSRVNMLSEIRYGLPKEEKDHE